MPDKIYCYPDSDVLKNRMGIWDREQLGRLEKRLTMPCILELIDKPIQGKFDLKHLQSISISTSFRMYMSGQAG